MATTALTPLNRIRAALKTALTQRGPAAVSAPKATVTLPRNPSIATAAPAVSIPVPPPLPRTATAKPVPAPTVATNAPTVLLSKTTTAAPAPQVLPATAVATLPNPNPPAATPNELPTPPLILIPKKIRKKIATEKQKAIDEAKKELANTLQLTEIDNSAQLTEEEKALRRSEVTQKKTVDYAEALALAKINNAKQIYAAELDAIKANTNLSKEEALALRTEAGARKDKAILRADSDAREMTAKAIAKGEAERTALAKLAANKPAAAQARTAASTVTTAAAPTKDSTPTQTPVPTPAPVAATATAMSATAYAPQGWHNLDFKFAEELQNKLKTTTGKGPTVKRLSKAKAEQMFGQKSPNALRAPNANPPSPNPQSSCYEITFANGAKIHYVHKQGPEPDFIHGADKNPEGAIKVLKASQQSAVRIELNSQIWQDPTVRNNFLREAAKNNIAVYEMGKYQNAQNTGADLAAAFKAELGAQAQTTTAARAPTPA